MEALMDSRTYSSYDLDKFQTCPKLWSLSKRWEVPENDWSVSLHLGWVISVGLAALRQGKSEKVAKLLAASEMEKRYEENDEWMFPGIMKHVYRGMELGIGSDLGLKSIISADRKQYGHTRPDVVGRTPDGGLRIVDDKTKLKLDSKYLDETLSEYRHSNQLYSGAWEVSQYYNEPVTSVGINLIVLSPNAKAYFYPFKIDPELLEYWAEGANLDFIDMSLVETGHRAARPRWTSCTTRYNKPGTFEKQLCPMHEICHDLHGDEARAEALGYRRR
jgi:hypothetical protein